MPGKKPLKNMYDFYVLTYQGKGRARCTHLRLHLCVCPDRKHRHRIGIAARPAHRAVFLAVPQVGQREQRHLGAVGVRLWRRRERRFLAPAKVLQRRSRAAPCQRLMGVAPQPAVILAESAHICPSPLQHLLVGDPDARRELPVTLTKTGEAEVP